MKFIPKFHFTEKFRLIETDWHTTTITCSSSEFFFWEVIKKHCRHCRVMLYLCKRLLVNNSWQCHQKHDKMKLSFSDIEANMGKMRETLKSEFGRDRTQKLKIFGQTEILEKTSFWKALRNFSRDFIISL